MIWTALGRLLLVPIGLILAALASAAVILSLGLEKLTHVVHGKDGAEIAGTALDILDKGAALASGLTLVPVLAVVAIGEIVRIRSWLYYMVGGGLALASQPLMGQVVSGSAILMPPPLVLQVLATAGFAGGLVYWLVAGRTV